MVDEQYSLAEYLMREASLPCLRCGSDNTETVGHYDDGLAVSVTFKCLDCRVESRHIMGMELGYWARIKKLRSSAQTAKGEP